MLYVHRGETKGEVYICLFTCVTRRAVHLKITLDMTGKFCVGIPKVYKLEVPFGRMISDNASWPN